jgi:hypothetical protein
MHTALLPVMAKGRATRRRCASPPSRHDPPCGRSGAQAAPFIQIESDFPYLLQLERAFGDNTRPAFKTRRFVALTSVSGVSMIIRL